MEDQGHQVAYESDGYSNFVDGSPGDPNGYVSSLRNNHEWDSHSNESSDPFRIQDQINFDQDYGDSCLKINRNNVYQTRTQGSVSSVEANHEDTSKSGELRKTRSSSMVSYDLASNDCSDSNDDFDEHFIEWRKKELKSNTRHLLNQAKRLREMEYREKMAQLAAKKEQVRLGTAKEYLDELSVLEENLRISKAETEKLHQVRLACLQNKYDAIEQSFQKEYELRKQEIYNSKKRDLQAKIIEEEGDKDVVESDKLVAALNGWMQQKRANAFRVRKNNKRVIVSKPYFVYQHSDEKIMQDMFAIKKALTDKRTIK